MSDAERTCEYVLDPDDPKTWGGEEGDECYVEEEVLNKDGIWTCPHDAEENKDLCIFHLPVEEKSDYVVTDTFLQIMNEYTESEFDGREKRLQFIGGRFGKLNLSENKKKITIGGEGVKMTHAKFHDDLDFSNTIFEVSYIDLTGVECAGDAIFSGVFFRGQVTFSSAKFRKAVNFQSAEFQGDVFFQSTKFEDNTRFQSTKFRQSAIFHMVEFRNGVNFVSAVLNRANFGNADFGGDADFRQMRAKNNIGFALAEFGGDTDFRDSLFEGELIFKPTEVRGDISFIESTFKDNATFETNFKGEINFIGSKFTNGVDLSGLDLNNSKFYGSDLTDAQLNNTKLCDANLEGTLLSRASLLNADLRGASIFAAVLGDAQISEDTQFLGNPSDDSETSPHTLSSLHSQPYCFYDPKYEYDKENTSDIRTAIHGDIDRAKSVYRTLEELGGKHARPRLQARSFVRRQDLQKQDYWDDATAPDASLEERLIAGARWSRARMARATLLYGESPWRVIGWSFGIILSFALLYPLGGWMQPEGGDPITYAQIASNPAEILNSIYYSTLTYTALGFGDFQPVGFGRLLTTVETGLGAVMLALLVFILGRRAAR